MGPKYLFSKDILLFVLVAVVISNTLIVILAILILILGGLYKPEMAFEMWIRMWIGAFIGTAMITPLIVFWSRKKGTEKWLKALVANGSEVIILLDKEGIILYASPSVEKILGYKPEQLMGRDIVKMMSSQDMLKISAVVKNLVENPGKRSIFQARLIKKDLTVTNMEGNASNLLTDPSVGSIVVSFQDINERLRLDQARTEFISLSAHQLRSPLSVIRWGIESLATDEPLSEGSKKNLSDMYIATLNMNETIGTLLGVSRFELGTVSVIQGDVNFPVIISEILADKKHQISDSRILIKQLFPPNFPEIQGDAKLVKVVIENLISNSLKYTPPGGVIEINLTSGEGEGPQRDKVLLAIKDSGVGIPADERDKIFTKSFRGSNVRKSVPGGLGLGLYLVRLIVQMLGGKIWFESEEGKGSTFFVEFPKGSKKLNG